MKRKRILTALIVLALVFIWGNSLVSGELSGRISDNILLFMNAAAEKLGFGQDTFTYMMDEDGDGVAEQPTSHIIRKAAHVTEYAVFAALVFFRLESRGKKRFFTAWGLAALREVKLTSLFILSKKPRRVCARKRKQSSKHFCRRRVRRQKYFSARKRAHCAL